MRSRCCDMAVQGADAGLFELDLEDFSLPPELPRRCASTACPELARRLMSATRNGCSLLHPDDSTLPPPLASGAQLGSEPVAFEFRVRDTDGKVRWLRSLSHAIPSATDSMTRLAGLVFDDTERKLAEQKLLASEEHMQMVQRAAHIGTYQTDMNMVSICSKQFYRNLGVDEDTPRLSEADYAALIHPEDRAKAAAEGHAAMASNADSIENEFRIVRADDGEVRWMFNRTRYLRDAKGRMIGAIGAHMDITDRKRAEEAARAGEALNLSIIEASADCIALLDVDGQADLHERRTASPLPGSRMSPRSPGGNGPNAGRPTYGRRWTKRSRPRARAGSAASPAAAARRTARRPGGTSRSRRCAARPAARTRCSPSRATSPSRSGRSNGCIGRRAMTR